MEVKRWDKREVVKFIRACLDDKGIPVFRTRFQVPRIRYPGEYVLASCWGGYDRVGSVLFYSVPESEVAKLERTVGDWKYLLKEYGTFEDVIEALKKHEVVIHS